jgi:hypothetical protein
VEGLEQWEEFDYAPGGDLRFFCVAEDRLSESVHVVLEVALLAAVNA